jgi:hypothetical protein
MSPEPPPPDIAGPPVDPPGVAAPENYPFWGYLDLAGFVIIALLALLVESLLAGALLSVVHVRKFWSNCRPNCCFTAFCSGCSPVIFRRYYGRPFWQSLRWVPAGLSACQRWLTCGVLLAFGVMAASVLLKTPDIDSPMKELLSDETSMVLIAVFGTTLGRSARKSYSADFCNRCWCGRWGAVPGVAPGGHTLRSAAFAAVRQLLAPRPADHPGGRRLRLDAVSHRIDQGGGDHACGLQWRLLCAVGGAAAAPHAL